MNLSQELESLKMKLQSIQQENRIMKLQKIEYEHEIIDLKQQNEMLCMRRSGKKCQDQNVSLQ